MAKVVSVEFTSHTDDVTRLADEQIMAWLSAIGEDAAHTAAERAPVDTGRLKNSISWATQAAHGGGDSMPLATPEKNSVYIGSNVHDEKGNNYAIYQEFGTSRGVTGKHFIQFGASAHAAEYGRLLEQYLKQ